jgi:hypothetical protein
VADSATLIAAQDQRNAPVFRLWPLLGKIGNQGRTRTNFLELRLYELPRKPL